MPTGGAIRSRATNWNDVPTAFNDEGKTRCVPAGIKILRNVMIKWVLHSQAVCVRAMWAKFGPIYQEMMRKKNRAARFWLNKNMKEGWSKWAG